ncbi:MAG TPA: TM2 domain-containing protein [Candidatus Aquilonibacter sp.]|nr:TM2 domain-containing protein [Candidatus Aquilonibacter sp.]
MNDRVAWHTALRRDTHASEKNWWVVFVLSVALGVFGGDRFYLGSFGLGLLKLATCGGFFLWWLADLVLLFINQIHDADGDLVQRPF